MLPAAVWSEIDSYKAALEQCFKTRGETVIFFERNMPTKASLHMHLQAVPVNSALLDKAIKLFDSEAQRLGIQFHIMDKSKVSLKQVTSAKGVFLSSE